eukprot:6035217-Prymnesium_polylepis.2
MGGITPESLADSSEELEPEGHTHNLDPEASKFVFSRCQVKQDACCAHACARLPACVSDRRYACNVYTYTYTYTL